MFEKIKKILRRILKTTVISIPFIVGLILFIIFQNPLFLIIGLGVNLVTSNAYIEKLNQDQNLLAAYIYNSETESIRQEFLDTESNMKADLDIELGNFLSEDKNNAEIKLVDPKKIEATKKYSKDDIVKRIVDEIDTYYYCQNFPPLNVSDKALDAYFDKIYESFLSENIESKYYKCVSDIVRKTIVGATVSDSKEIQMTDMIDGIGYLKDHDFSEAGINFIKEIIKEAINKEKIVVFQQKLK